MIVIPSLKEVTACWNTFNNLTAPWCGEGGRGGSPPALYKSRDDAWKIYCHRRDHYLYSLGIIGLAQLNSVWYPRMVAEAHVSYVYKN
jgi:hypothetical protein